MSGSVFGRINRAEYRREMARYPISGSKHLLTYRMWLSYAMLAPVFYGALIGYLHAEYPGAYEAAVAWADPWLVDWLKDYFPALNNIAENYTLRGYEERIPFAQHVYASGALFFALYMVLFGVALYTLPRSVRAKRFFAFHQKRRFAGSRSLYARFQGRMLGGGNVWWLVLGALGLCMSAYMAVVMYDGSWNTGETHSSGSWQGRWLTKRIRGLHIYDSGAALHMLFAVTAALLSVFTPLIVYYKGKFLFINLKQGWKMRWSANRRR